MSEALCMKSDEEMISWLSQFVFDADFRGHEEVGAVESGDVRGGEDSGENSAESVAWLQSDHFSHVEEKILKEYLESHGVDISSCAERTDYIQKLNELVGIESECKAETDPCILLADEIDFRLVQPFLEHFSYVHSPSFFKLLQAHPGSFFPLRERRKSIDKLMRVLDGMMDGE